MIFATLTFPEFAVGVLGVLAFACIVFMVVYAVISGTEDFK